MPFSNLMQGGKTSSWSVADNLVCMGFAAFTNHMSEHTANPESDTKQHKEVIIVVIFFVVLNAARG